MNRGKRTFVSRRCRALVEACDSRTLLAFGLTTTSTNYTVDTGAGVTFSVLRNGTSSTIHSGDLTSFKLNGVEFQAPYSSTSRYSHFESGLSNPNPAAVPAFIGTQVSATIDPSPTPQWIKITCDDTTATVGTGATGVIQYYMARRNDPVIYMATYAPEMLVSSTRFITYLDWSKFPNHPDESDGSGSLGGIETADVQGHADGTTSSKYYGETRNIDHTYIGATGPSSGAYMFFGDRSRGAGGPFWKDIDFQGTGAAVELYNMPYSGHSLTDTFRPGLHGPYALVLTDGSAPATTPNYSFIDGLGLSGWVPFSSRATLSGKISGITPGRAATVALSNSAAQYWDRTDAAGNYTITDIEPGTYTETLYEEELAVGTRSVTIAAGQSLRADINATGIFGLNGANNVFTTYNSSPAPIWRIGTWDGTPREFLNGDKITIMHPTDIRLSPWAVDSTGTTNFTIGTNKDSEWPMAEWKTQVTAAPWVDTRNRITFTLTAAQRAQALTLRIGVVRTNSERPGVSANGGTTQFGAILTQPDTRGLSLGNWRGNNGVYSYNFAANSLIAGTNTFDIYAISGSTFTGYFAGYHIYDAVELIPTANNTAPAITTLTLSPGNSTNITTNASRLFGVVGRDSTNTVRGVNAVFSALRGTINNAGEYVAPATPGTDTITVTYTNPTGSSSTTTLSSSVSVNIVSTAPTIATPASASPRPVYTNQTTLSVLGADDNGEAALIYTWSVVGTPPAAVTFGAGNGTNAGKTLSATFTQPGNYTFAATITDASGNTTASQTTVAVMNEKAWYKLDLPNGQAITDATASQQTGVLYGKFAFPQGVSNGAVQLLGGAMTLPPGVVNGLTDFTIGTWVKPDSLANWARVFDFGNGTTSYMYLTARSGLAGNAIRFAITTSGGAGEQAVTGPTLATGVWTHLAVSLSGTTATLYVNGVAAGSNTGVTLNPAALGNTILNYIGESQFTADPTFLGAFDDFRVYGRALSGTEVSALAKPTIVTAAAAAPSPTTSTTTLSVLGDDLTAGASNLTYSWSAVGSLPAPVTFNANGTNAAKSSVATFTKAGTYTLRATITNTGGNTVTSDVTVIVTQVLTSLTLSPSPVTLSQGATQAFTAAGTDQFGDSMTPATPAWSLQSGGGSINASGVYTAPSVVGSAVVKATVGALTATVSVTIIDTAAPTVASSAFQYQTGQSIVINFSEDVLASLAVDDLIITDLATNTPLASGSFTFSTQGIAGQPTVGTWSRNIAANGVIPNGNYRVTLASGGVADAAGNVLTAAFSLDFFVLAGDANRDRSVDFSDLLILAQNYGLAGKTFGEGNFNYDAAGNVDFDDLLIISQGYGSTLFSSVPVTSARSSRRGGNVTAVL